MSRGTKHTILRLAPELLARIHEAIDQNNSRRADEPYNLTSWIRQAIEERLAKLERGRKANERKRKGAADQVEARQLADQVEGEQPTGEAPPAAPQ